MENPSKTVVTISREKAAFRLDRHGNWHTDEGKFTNRKIIRYFHSMIRRDEQGYFLEQEREQIVERVYFPYEDTALFVFHVEDADDPVLCLNTGEKMVLNPEDLFVKNDGLYSRRGAEIVKFTESALLSLSENLEEVEGRLVLNLGGRSEVIREVIDEAGGG